VSDLALVFPGQGAQEVGMLADLAAEYPVVQETFAEASAVLGFDLWALAQQGPESELAKTAITQPIVLTASVATYRVWRARTAATVRAMAGHSLGEYTALVCSDAMAFADAVRLVRLRGEAMQRAVPEGVGAVAAVLGIDDDVTARCCAEASALGVVSCANYNSPGQVVIAGASAAVDRAIELCKAAGAKRAMRMALSVPVHCALMAPAAAEMTPALEAVALAMPSVDVVQNVDAQVPADVATIRRKLIEQIHQPVQWTRCVEALAGLGARRLVECGPGRVLAGLVKRIDKSLAIESAGSQAGLAAALELSGA
jgi:[acyl-carrier-protein] S-malonyltransferase